MSDAQQGEHMLRAFSPKHLRRRVNLVFKKGSTGEEPRLKRVVSAQQSHEISSTDPALNTASQLNIGQSILDPHNLGKNGLLWLRAQDSVEVQGDKLWPGFAREFRIVRGIPCIDSAIAHFSHKASQEEGRSRRVFNLIVKFAHDNKEAGNGLAAIDPTKATSAAVSL